MKLVYKHRKGLVSLVSYWKLFQDDVETINVVLNPDKVWDADELDQHFDTVAGDNIKK